MCFGKPTPPPPAPPVQAPPTREQIAAEKINSVQDSKGKMSARTGVYGNINTSRSGDSKYGTDTALATFGTKPSTLGSA
jgi:hypothetical protein